jgi:hypothetical protein
MRRLCQVQRRKQVGVAANYRLSHLQQNQNLTWPGNIYLAIFVGKSFSFFFSKTEPPSKMARFSFKFFLKQKKKVGKDECFLGTRGRWKFESF